MEFTLEEQFLGFLETSQIFAENAFFEYPLFETPAITAKNGPLKLTEPQSRVLGKRMEHFFSYYVSHFSSLQVLSQNQQIIREKKTLGELDFLLKDTASQVFHVELIYKFYLYDPESGTSEKDHLIGPNRRDSLNRKLERLQKRQFPLLFHETTKDLLESLQVTPEDVVQQMCFKASVFLPKFQRNTKLSEINPATVAGYWIKRKDFTEDIYGQSMFFSPKKKYWPVRAGKNKSWHSYTEILKMVEPFMQSQLSLMLWMKTPGGQIQKFFIVWW